MKRKVKMTGMSYHREMIQLMSETNVLNAIIEGVVEDLQPRLRPLTQLRSEIESAPKLLGAYKALSSSGTRLIAEVKRSSPSKGDLAQISDPVALAAQYQEGGADVISVLTENRRFKGSIKDFTSIRKELNVPMLRKDFIVTEFQVLESRLLGADLLLLIVAALTKSDLTDFYQLATELGMDVLVEVHDLDEAGTALDIGAKIIGVNSRNLKTLEVDESNFALILPQIPSNVIKVAESGISTRSQVAHVENLGANAVLIGESLVKAGNPLHTINELLNR